MHLCLKFKAMAIEIQCTAFLANQKNSLIGNFFSLLSDVVIVQFYNCWHLRFNKMRGPALPGLICKDRNLKNLVLCGFVVLLGWHGVNCFFFFFKS